MYNMLYVKEKIKKIMKGKFIFSTIGEGFKGKYPIADGTFIQADMIEKWDDSKWESEFNYLKEVNMHYMVIGASITQQNITKTIYPSKIPGMKWQCLETDVLDKLLKNAEKAGFKVFIGSNFNSDWWEKGAKDPKWLYAQMEMSNLIAEELYIKYHHKYPKAFHGWYFIYEVDNLNFKTKEHFKVLAKAMNINLKYLKEKNYRLPFLWSPFMNSMYGSAEEYAKNWRYLFGHIDIEKGDIFCPQDSVGGGGLKLEQVQNWFSKLKKAVDSKPGLCFWANTETFNHLDWSSATLNRFIKQMKIESRYVENFITFAYSHYYSPNNIEEGFHNNYLYYVQNGHLNKHKPSKPKNVVVKKIGNNNFLITWEPPQNSEDIYEYRVFRNKKLVFSTKVQRIYGGNKVGLLNSFMDKLILNLGVKPIIYEVKAIDFSGNISKGSWKIQ